MIPTETRNDNKNTLILKLDFQPLKQKILANDDSPLEPITTILSDSPLESTQR